jgi:TolB protein
VTGVSAKVSWSPDGQQIAYFTAEGTLLSLRIFHVESRLTTLALPLHGVSLDEAPSWSPDGEQVALFQYDNFGADIFTVDLAGQSVQWLTEGKGASAYPRWSPNGEMLAYYVNSGGQMRLFLATVEGDNARVLANLRVNDLSFAWRPCVAVGC